MNYITAMALIAGSLLILDQSALAQGNEQATPVENLQPLRFFGRPVPAQSNSQTLPVETSLVFNALDHSATPPSCKDARGNLVEFYGGGNDSRGRLTNGGWLDGATLVVFNSPGFPTPVPNAFTFSGTHTLTTNHGQLKGTRLFLYDNGAGWGMDMTIIDPSASTGIFAGATGVVYGNQVKNNTAPPPTTYLSEVRAFICFARGMEPRDK